MKKGQISNLIRRTGLLQKADHIRYYLERFRNRKANKEFLRKHPDVKLPPGYLIYESFQLNYKKYYSDSEDTARWIAGLLKRHIDLKGIKILDWGCGPGRVIRHFPKFTADDCQFFGTDYNQKSIAWCSAHLPGIHFSQNTLKACLKYDDNFFDVIYGISILTHLSEKMHFEWVTELVRVPKPGGIMLLTTQGENFTIKLTHEELVRFNSGKPVVRGNVKEGHRTWSAFQPKKFMKILFTDVEVLEHLERKPEQTGWLPQDVWIIKKRNS